MQRNANSSNLIPFGFSIVTLVIAIASIALPICVFLFTKTSFELKFIICAVGFFICGIITTSMVSYKQQKGPSCQKYITNTDILNDLAYNIGDIADPDVIFNRLTTALNKKFGDYNCVLAKFDSANSDSSIFSLWVAGSKPLMINETNHIDHEFDIDEITNEISNLNETDYILQPIYTQNISLGEIRIWKKGQSPCPITTDDNQFLITSSNISALALTNIKASSNLMNNTVRDAITGLYNKSYLADTIERELHRAHRCNFPIGILMIEIDKFDEIIENFTSEAGNKILSSVAGLLQGTFRGHDISCRYSKNVFIQVLPEASLENTLKRAEELSQWITELNVKYMGDALPAITSSIGIACYPNHADNCEELMEAVISATFRAKQSGMDQIVIAEKVFNAED